MKMLWMNCQKFSKIVHDELTWSKQKIAAKQGVQAQTELGELVDPKGEKYGAMKHFAIFIPSIPLQTGGQQRTSRGKQRDDHLYLLRRGPSGSCSGRSSSAPRPWRRCRPGWPGSWCRCRPPSLGPSSGTCWASPCPSASPAQLQVAKRGFEGLGNVGKSHR